MVEDVEVGDGVECLEHLVFHDVVHLRLHIAQLGGRCVDLVQERVCNT